MLTDHRIGFIGAGNMTEALIAGLRHANLLPGAGILASDIIETRLTWLEHTYKIGTTHSNRAVAQGADILVLAVIVLSPSVQTRDSKVILNRLSNREAFIAILKQSFQLNFMDLARMTRHVKALGRIIPRLPSFRLSMPHDYDVLPLVRRKILETLLSSSRVTS